MLEAGARNPAFYWLAGVAIIGVVISLYYYFGVIRAMYWAKDPADLSPIRLSWPSRLTLGVCVAGMLFLGIWPSGLMAWATQAVQVLGRS